MTKKFQIITVVLAVGLLMGGYLLTGSLSDAHAAELSSEKAKWLKENKIGPYQEDKVDYDALYQAAKKEGKVVVYSSTSRGPKSFALGFHKKYPGIKVEWNTIGTGESLKRLMAEQKAGIYSVDLINASDPPTQFNVYAPAHMLFPWTPPELRGAIPKNWQNPLLVHRLTQLGVMYSTHEFPNKPPIDSWWDATKPEWKGRLVTPDPRVNAYILNQLITLVLNADEMAEDYKRVFGKPIQLTTPNAGYEWIKRFFANEPKLVKKEYDARFAGKPGLANSPLIIPTALARVSDAGNPKYGNIRWAAATELKPRFGLVYPTLMNIAYKSPHPNAAKLVIRWLMGNDQGKAGFSPWFVPGYLPARTDVIAAPPHPFIPELSWSMKGKKYWYMNAEGIWEKRTEVLDFIFKLLQ